MKRSESIANLLLQKHKSPRLGLSPHLSSAKEPTTTTAKKLPRIAYVKNRPPHPGIPLPLPRPLRVASTTSRKKKKKTSLTCTEKGNTTGIQRGCKRLHGCMACLGAYFPASSPLVADSGRYQHIHGYPAGDTPNQPPSNTPNKPKSRLIYIHIHKRERNK